MKTEKIPYLRIVLYGLVIIFWSMYLVISGMPNTFGWAIIAFVYIFWMVATPYYIYKVLRRRIEPDEVGTTKDERSTFNDLRASKNGFLFLLFSMINIIFGWAFGMIDELTAINFFVIAFGLGLFVHILSYWVYERRG